MRLRSSNMSSFLVSPPFRMLQETETDQRLLRSMSGAWFTDERNKRHHTWSSSALVHATIRHKRTKSRGARAPLLPMLARNKGAAL